MGGMTVMLGRLDSTCPAVHCIKDLALKRDTGYWAREILAGS
jgi:hypothetical protein